MSEKRSGYQGLLAAAAIILTLAVSLLINIKMLEQSEKRACGTLRALIQAYNETPPTTPAGRNIEQAYRSQYMQYNCAPQMAPIIRSTLGNSPSPTD